MGLLKRVLGPAISAFDRRVDWRVDRKAARHEDPAAISDSLTKVYADLLEATTDVRRWLADDLDAAQETADLVGRSLVRLTDEVGRLGDEVARLSERVARLETPPPA
jgi:ubiquinone biosynthesis protein UbiJ